MKKSIICLVLAISFFGCEQEGELTKTPETVVIEEGAEPVVSNQFSSETGYTANGQAKVFIVDGQTSVRLENLIFSDGPDLKVYLSNAKTPNGILNLGNFKGNGTTVYTVPEGFKITDYKYVLVHCQQFNRTFGFAQLTVK